MSIYNTLTDLLLVLIGTALTIAICMYIYVVAFMTIYMKTHKKDNNEQNIKD